MKKGFRIVFVICLVAMLLVCQNAAFIPQSQNYFCSHPFISSLLLRADIIFTTYTLFLDDESSEDDFIKLPARPFEIYLSTTKVMPVRIKRTSDVLQIADIRSNIEKAIPQYFNGSKYKSIHLNA